MTEPDSQRVLAPLSRAALFLTLTVAPGAEPAVREELAHVDELRKSVGFRAVDEELSCVVGVGSDCWDRLYGSPRPGGLHPFRALDGPRHRAPATPGDLFLHLRSARPDLCFELATLILGRLRGHAEVVDEVHGFRSFDERDLLGFVDGTANPEGAAARASVLVGDDDPDFAGGSYLVVQKYTHDLDGWTALSVEDQERVVGRTKLEDVELADAVKPADSHVALASLTDDTGEREFVRFNMPFGRVGAREFGTYFIGYTADPTVVEAMLAQMFLGTSEASHDRILDFSTAHTGCLFFVPTAAFLADPPTPAGAAGPG